MESKFWQQRWQEGKIGFHLDEVNPLLVKYAEKMQLAPGQQVFVPLSGKSRDLIWLAEQGFRVLAIELSEVAVDAFFEENNLTPFKVEKGELTFYQAGLITFICGDFFQLTPEKMVNIAAVYDRAALIALPVEMRTAYCQHLQDICPSQPRLLITLEYDQSEMNGPPFAVNKDELSEHYARGYTMELLDSSDVLKEHAHFAAKGVNALSESVYILHRD